MDLTGASRNYRIIEHYNIKYIRFSDMFGVRWRKYQNSCSVPINTSSALYCIERYHHVPYITRWLFQGKL